MTRGGGREPQAPPGVLPTASLQRAELAFALVLTAAFLIACGLLMTRHEMWRDEVRAWQLAQDCGSLRELFAFLPYEGHPSLWYLGLFLLTRVTHQVGWMQALHLGLAGTSAFLFLRWAPFSRLARGLFVFGYFPLYEYGVISRNYAWGVLLLFAACALFPARGRRLWPLAAVLALLMQTSALGLILGVAFASALALDLGGSHGRSPGSEWRPRDLAVSGALVVAGAAAAVLQVLPPPDGPSYAHEWTRTLDSGHLAAVIASVWKGCVPITDPGNYQFWNTNVLDTTGFQPALGLALIVLGVAAVYRSRPALLFLVIGSIGLLAFGYLKWMGSVRHHGHLFLLFVACLWLMWSERPLSTAADPNRARRVIAGATTTLFAVHALAAALAALMDWKLPFSGGQEAAALIRAQHLDARPIIGFPDLQAASVAGHLDQPIFYPAWGRRARFVRCDSTWKNVSVWDVMTEARAVAQRTGEDVVLVVNQPLPEPHDSITAVGAAEVSIVPDEAFIIYRVEAHPAGR